MNMIETTSKIRGLVIFVLFQVVAICRYYPHEHHPTVKLELPSGKRGNGQSSIYS